MPRFGPTHRKILATLSLAATALPPALAAADESDEACYPPSTSIGWTQPKAVPISADGAVRWPLDATMRVAYGGDWCPDDVRVTVERKDDGTGIPAEVRIRTPLATFKNEPFPLSLIDIDPIPTLEPSTDYVMTLRPENPALALFEEYVIEFRTSRREMDPLGQSDFAGIAGVEGERDDERCWGNKLFKFADSDDMAPDPPCARERRLELRVAYQPIDSAYATYGIYHTRSVPLDEEGNPKLDDPTINEEPALIGFEAGSSDQGAGLPLRRTPVTLPYMALPRRECFAVVVVDEWGRDVQDLSNEACIDIPVLEPCPQPSGMMQAYPPPNPFDLRTPVDGQACDDVCLNDGDCASHEPGEAPVGGSGGGGGEGGAGGGEPGGDADGGVGGADGGTGGTASKGGSSGCTTRPGSLPSSNLALVAGLSSLLLGLRRRRTRG